MVNFKKAVSKKAKAGATKLQSVGATKRTISTTTARQALGAKPKAEATPATNLRLKSLAKAGIANGGDVTWTKVNDWFENEEAEFSRPFIMHKAKHQQSQLGEQVVFTVSEDGAEKVLLGLSFNSEREDYALYFKRSSEPLGWLVMQRIDVNKPSPYIKILDLDQANEEGAEISEDEIPF